MEVNHIEIDNSIIENAIRLSGVKDRKELIEKVLLFFAQQQKNPVQKIINDFYNLPISELETLETSSVYQGNTLSLENIEQAINYEAGLHK
jgi:Bacterial antitoxin of type II TA system, VapB